ncbi:MAG: folate-binding protein [Pseudomonadota bacterium]
MASPFVYLAHRAVLSLTGPDTLTLLERLVTHDTTDWPVGEARYGGLLTPQGKVIADYLALRTADGILMDMAAAFADDLAKRLKLFRLRSDVEIVRREDLFVLAGLEPALQGPRPVSGALHVFVDQRYEDGRLRAFATLSEWQAWYGYHPAEWSRPVAIYHADRIAHGVPEQGVDFGAAEVFPSDINMDLFGGVALNKGCFVGQEVVSRMHRRGKVRRRTIVLSGEMSEPDELMVDGDTGVPKPIGDVTSLSGNHALAQVRVDRLAKAEADAKIVSVDGRPVRVEKPDWLGEEMATFLVDG